MPEERVQLVAKNPPFKVIPITSGVQVVTENFFRVWLSLINQGGFDVTLHLGKGPVISLRGIQLKALGGTVVFDRAMPWPGAIQAVSDGAALSVLQICEVEVKH